jgi:hypothetical protein
LAIPTPLRYILVVVVGAAIYYALLGLLYANAPYAVIPHWWRQLASTASVAVITWFTLLNVGGAVLAAVPLAFLVVVASPRRRIPVALLIGVPPAAYILVGGFLAFGAPPNTSIWIVAVAQFLAISLAVVAVTALIADRPLITAWGGSES